MARVQAVADLYLNLPISQMFGFLFSSPWPTDSIPSMDTLLNTKPYIKSNGFAASVWLNVVSNVLTVSNQLGGYIMVKVPVGKEGRWVEDLKTSPLVSWAELNCYIDINGYP